MSTNRPTPASLGGLEQIAAALDHHPLELLLLALADGDEVDDGVDALDGAAQAGRIGHVTLDDLAPERLGLAGVAREGAHVLSCREQGGNDVAPHESGGARNEDHFAGSRSKFCQ